jgi:cyclophilin family peptidyl-prolyl cis-trans isomerase
LKNYWIVVVVLVVVVVAFFVGFWIDRSGSGPSGQKPVVVIETSMGTIKAELYPDKAPVTVKNFLQYVDDHFYDNTLIHRVVPGFVIQGGGFAPGRIPKKTRPEIRNESSNGLSNTRGTLAMARTDMPDSASSQFYINIADNSKKLDKDHEPRHVGYCVFGKVIEGMDVADKIDAVPTEEGDFPKEEVLIKTIRRAE